MKLKKDYWVAILCKICVIMTELLITVFINRGLGIETKGEYAYIIKIVEVLYVLLSFGIGQAYSTFKRLRGDDIKGVFVSLGLIHGVLIVVFGSVYSAIFKPDYGFVIMMLTAIAVIKLIISMIAVIEKSITRNILQALINVLYLVALAVLYFLHLTNLNSVIMCYALSDIVRITILMIIYQMKPSMKKCNFDLLKAIYKMGFVTMLVMLLISLNYSVDTIMLKKLSTSYCVGIYSIGASLANIFLLIPDAFKEVLFGDSTKKDFSKSTAFSAIKVSLLISIVALIGFFVFGKMFITILYGVEYLPSYYVTLILFAGCFSLIIFKILQPVYISHGKQTKALFFLSCSAITNIIVNWIVIPKYNEIGAAIASVLSYTVCGLLFFYDYLKNGLGDKK